MSYVLVTDGACSGNGTSAARGGWAAILVEHGGEERVLTGGEVGSTNNRMELTAAIEGLRATPDGAQVELITDSSYVANAISKRWLSSWQKRGWKTADKKPVANQDLWQAMIAQLIRVRVTTTLVKGHAGHEANERADKLAQAAAANPSGRPSAAATTPTAPLTNDGQLSLAVDDLA